VKTVLGLKLGVAEPPKYDWREGGGAVHPLPPEATGWIPV